ncbi:LysM peptidoglycan-binding domain-containing protein [Psychrobacillus sp.]|uniref:cell division suppressor protein YneA n=1 Tax=Psychrobacillus sp. TaxID=1871623 RepID=UPI0028BEBC30|nr:LysM peptidoglycan-binding domain-containing protein [Psychrobacillus sp.]
MKLMKENYFITLFLGLSIIFIMSVVFSNIVSTESEHQIKIENGDSLWSLADKFGSHEPKESWINQVMAMNNLQSSHIEAGEVLIIPEIKETFHFEHETELAGDSR